MKIFLLVFIGLIFGTSVPTKVLTEFKNQYPQASNVEWFNEHAKYSVIFETNTHKKIHLMYGGFSEKLEQTFNFKPNSEMLTNTKDFLGSNYRNKVVKSYWFKREGIRGIIYKIIFVDNKSIYFDTKGRFMF